MVETIFSSSTTWTCPVGVTDIAVICIGGGGAGGGVLAQPSTGGGGAGGSIAIKQFTVVPETEYDVIVGSGGVGGYSSGGAGSPSYFINELSVFARGGGGGGGTNEPYVNSSPALGSSGGCIGTVVRKGGDGGYGNFFGGGSGAGGGAAATGSNGKSASGSVGGSAILPYSGNGANGVSGTQSGSAGGNYGGGGSGASATTGKAGVIGGNGGDGLVVILYEIGEELTFVVDLIANSYLSAKVEVLNRDSNDVTLVANLTTESYLSAKMNVSGVVDTSVRLANIKITSQGVIKNWWKLNDFNVVMPSPDPDPDPDPPESALELTFDDITNVPVADAYSISDWNTFFDLPTNGNPFTSVESNVLTEKINYGFLYNWYAATDERDITSSDTWRVTESADWKALLLDLGGIDQGSIVRSELPDEFGQFPLKNHYPLCDSDSQYWDTFVGTNTLNFNLRGSGFRYVVYDEEAETINTYFDSKGTHSYILCSDTSNGNELFIVTRDLFSVLYLSFWSTSPTAKKTGYSIRLVRPATAEELLLSDGTTCDPYTGNDGKSYRTVKLLGLVWIADYLAETKFRNGDYIPGFDGGVYTPISNEAWAALTTGALCAYDDNIDNAYTTNCLIRLIGGSDITIKNSLFKNNSYLIAFVDEEAIVITIMANSFDNCGATAFTMRGVTNLGGTTGNDNVFASITGKAITLTIPSALMTCNGGNPDGDIQWLIDNNTVTIITV